MDARPGWLDHFPALAALDDPAWHEVLTASRTMTVPAGTTVFHEGAECTVYMLVLHGSVRVQKTAENGREITLYRVENGQSCVLTTSCLLAGDRYPAEGVTETEVEAVTIPVAAFQQGLDGSPGFRRFVFEAYGRRISNLVVLVEALAFGRLDSRLADLLLRRGSTGVVQATHHAMAAELGTAREVISRQLKEFERKDWVRLERGRVTLLDSAALQDLTEQPPA